MAEMPGAWVVQLAQVEEAAACLHNGIANNG